MKRITPIFFNNSNPRRWWHEIGFTVSIKHTTRTHDMNTVYLSQAEPLLRGAHAATINQKDRDELRAIHCRVLKFMRGTGIFIGEIAPDKTSAPKEEEGVPWCEPCQSWHDKPKSREHHAALQCFAPWIEPVGVLNGPIMDEDDARKHDQRQASATLEHNIACMVSDYENGNIAGGRLRWAAIKADLRGLS